jgi:homoserine kinase
MYKIKVPATSANIGPGYDSFGLALNLYNEYIFSLNSLNKFELSIKDMYNNELFINKEDNLIIQTADYIYQKYPNKIDLNQLKVDVQLNYPLDRGLGSSANAIIATIYGLNKLFNLNLDEQMILKYALNIEGHPDNITPALVGGFTISQIIDDIVSYQKLYFSDKLKILLFIPDIKLKTKTARKVINKTIPIDYTSKNIANASILTAGIIKNDLKLIKKGSTDYIHQNKRLSLNPKLKLLFKNINKQTNLPMFLSGSGPTIIFISDKNLSDIKNIVNNEAKKIGIVNYLIETKANNKGIIIKDGDKNVERFN